MNKWDMEYLRTQVRLQRAIDAVYTEAAKEAARIGANLSIADPDRIFSFADYPMTKKRVSDLLRLFSSRINATLINGINRAWDISNSKNDELCQRAHRNAQTQEQIIQNKNARQTFIQRTTAGLNLSDRVWNYTTQFKNEIELSLDCGIRDGLSTPEMSRELKKYLKHPDKLFRRIRDEHGILQLSKRAAAFHPGQGVYRSSYKNARRLAATETNIAYRTADHLRWQDMDFVVGIKIELSNNHTCLGADGRPHAFADICDDLQGEYPKTFKFVGWHPHCRCHAIPILKSLDEMNADTRSIIQGGEPINPTDSQNSVQQLPKTFTKWAKDNQQRIAKAKSMPYFIKDNFKTDSGKLTPLWKLSKQNILKQSADKAIKARYTASMLERAKQRHTARTEQEIQAIKDKWKEWRSPALGNINKELAGSRIEYNRVKPFKKQPTTEDIIDRLQGGDETKGSCASLAFAYAGNKAGYDVLDFRGGESRTFFSRIELYFYKDKDLNIMVERHTNDYKALAKLLTKVEKGEEYVLGTGKHAAIIRKSEKGYLEYLELQSWKKEENGFTPFTRTTLKKRFKAQQSHSNYGLKYEAPSFLINIKELMNKRNFLKMLGYINTDKAKQLKGITGGKK